MSFTDRQQDIIRKINALRRVAERTEFAGQREAALAAIDRLSVRYQVNVEQLRDDVKHTQIIEVGRGWKRSVAIHLGYYLGLKLGRTHWTTPGVFFLSATDAEFELWRDTFEFHSRLIGQKETQLRAAADALRLRIKEAKAALKKSLREKPGVMKWYVEGYVAEVLPLGKHGRKVRITPAQAAAHSAGSRAGKAVQVNSCPRSLPAPHTSHESHSSHSEESDA